MEISAALESLCVNTRVNKMDFISRVGITPATCRVYSHTLFPCDTIGLDFVFLFIIERCECLRLKNSEETNIKKT